MPNQDGTGPRGHGRGRGGRGGQRGGGQGKAANIAGKDAAKARVAVLALAVAEEWKRLTNPANLKF
jgi:hypothetical protein